jgi:hypothetical protein
MYRKHTTYFISSEYFLEYFFVVEGEWVGEDGHLCTESGEHLCQAVSALHHVLHFLPCRLCPLLHSLVNAADHCMPRRTNLYIMVYGIHIKKWSRVKMVFMNISDNLPSSALAR